MTRILKNQQNNLIKWKKNSTILKNTQKNIENIKKFSKLLSIPTLSISNKSSKNTRQSKRFSMVSSIFENMVKSGIK